MKSLTPDDKRILVVVDKILEDKALLQEGPNVFYEPIVDLLKSVKEKYLDLVREGVNLGEFGKSLQNIFRRTLAIVNKYRVTLKRYDFSNESDLVVRYLNKEKEIILNKLQRMLDDLSFYPKDIRQSSKTAAHEVFVNRALLFSLKIVEFQDGKGVLVLGVKERGNPLLSRRFRFQNNDKTKEDLFWFLHGFLHDLEKLRKVKVGYSSLEEIKSHLWNEFNEQLNKFGVYSGSFSY